MCRARRCLLAFQFSIAFIAALAIPLASAAAQVAPAQQDTADQKTVVQNTGDVAPRQAPTYLYYFDDRASGSEKPGSFASRPLGAQFRYTFTGAGRNENGGAMSQWSVGKGDVSWMDVYAAGIHQVHSAFTHVYGTGDNAWQYGYCETSGGVSDASGEGAECLAVQQMEAVSDYMGRVQAGSAGHGLREIHTDATRNAGTEGARRMLVNVSHEHYAGHVVSQTFYRDTELSSVEVDVPVTPSPWIGLTPAGHDVYPAVNLVSPPAVHVHFTTLRGTPTEGAHVCLAPVWGEAEELVLSHVSVSGDGVDADLSPRHGMVGATYAFQGPCEAFDAEGMRPHAGANWWRNTAYVLGYSDEHHVVVGYYAKGERQPFPPGAVRAVCALRNAHRGADGVAYAALDYEGCLRMAEGNRTAVISGTAHLDGPLAASPMYAVGHVGRWEVRWQTADHTPLPTAENGVIRFGNQDGAFHIYPMAMADNTCDPAVTTAPTFAASHPCINGYFHLELNSVDWHANDEVELPHYMAIRTAAGYFADYQYEPNYQTVPLSIVAGGKGVGNAPMLAMRVDDGPHDFLGDGGSAISAPLGIRFEGPNSGVVNALAPQGANGISYFLGCSQYLGHTDCAHTPQYYVLDMGGTGGMYSGGVRFSPSINELELFGVGGVQMDSALRLKSGRDNQPLHAPGDTMFFMYNEAGVDGRIRYLGTEQTPVPHTVATLDDLPLAATSAMVGGSPLTAGTCATAQVAMPGVTTGMAVVASPANGVDPGDGYFVRALATGAGQAAVKVCAIVPGTPAKTAYNLRAIR